MHFTVMLSLCLTLGLVNAVFPHCGSVWLLMVVSSCIGFCMGGCHTGLNVLVLEIWHGLNAAPYMHSLHFFFSVGAFVAPVLSRPFLAKETDDPLGDGTNATEHHVGETRVGALFPLTSLIVWAACLPVFVFSSRELLAVCRRRRAKAADPEEHKRRKEAEREKGAAQAHFFGNAVAVREKTAFLCLMVAFFLFYVCSEFSVISYLPTFAIHCELQLTRTEAADVMAISLLPFAVSRILVIFFAIKFSPTQILVFNLSLILTGNLIVNFIGYRDLTFLYIGGAFTGLGSGSMYGNTILWIAEYFPVKGRIASFLNGSGSIGVLFAPILIGATIEDTPMVLPRLQLCVTLFSIAVFAVCGLGLGRRIRRLEAEAKEQDGDRGEELEELNKQPSTNGVDVKA